jgi:hypothetical protein
LVDGTGAAARFDSAKGMAIDPSGNLYVIDSGTIRKITPAGVVTTLAGQYATSGSADGTGSAARFNSPFNLAADSSGNVFVADTENSTVRKVTSGGVVTTVGGFPRVMGGTDGVGGAAIFAKPFGVATSPSGDLFLADSLNHRIAKGLRTVRPIVTLDAYANLTVGSVTLQGSVIPNGLASTASFEYGLTPSYGSTAGVALSPDNGLTAVSVSSALAGLAPNTTYYYRLTAANAEGVAHTSGGTFTTPAATILQQWKWLTYGNADLPDDATPDGDGVKAVLKYALVLPVGVPAADSLPVGRVKTYSTSDRLYLTFLRDPARTALIIKVQVAPTLSGPWTVVATSNNGATFFGIGYVGETDAVGGYKRVEVRDIVSAAGSSQRYMRIQTTH